MAKKTLRVIPEKCIACSACVSLCPKSFTLNMNDPQAVAVAINPPKDSQENINLAIEACPTSAIEYK